MLSGPAAMHALVLYSTNSTGGKCQGLVVCGRFGFCGCFMVVLVKMSIEVLYLNEAYASSDLIIAGLNLARVRLSRSSTASDLGT